MLPVSSRSLGLSRSYLWLEPSRCCSYRRAGARWPSTTNSRVTSVQRSRRAVATWVAGRDLSRAGKFGGNNEVDPTITSALITIFAHVWKYSPFTSPRISCIALAFATMVRACLKQNSYCPSGAPPSATRRRMMRPRFPQPGDEHWAR